MAEWKLPFGEGGSINRPRGVNYQFWKIRIKFFIESLDRGISDAIVNDLYVPKTVVTIDKPWSEWSDYESKKT